LRRTLEQVSKYDAAVAALSEGALVNEVYYIVAGVKDGEGVVVSRDRNNDDAHTADAWTLSIGEDDGWFRLQTNYDHAKPVPSADDRRHPGIAAMKSMGRGGLHESSLRGVMQTWPVFNHHTDYTGIFVPKNATYISGVWL